MRKIYQLLLGVLLLFSIQSKSQISLSGPAYTQDFNSLALSGTSSTLPAGWLMLETGTNANLLYTAGTGSSNAGDTYSFGAAANAERAFGGLLSGSLTPTIGASFTNNTGSTLTSLTISYTGEQWRLGASPRATNDRLDFQYSVNATSLSTGTWTDENGLDFTAPIGTGTVGLLDGNAVANRTNITFTISSLSIANGATFFIRWSDFNVTSSDDGLGIDDFTVAATGGPGPLTITTASPLPGGTVGVPYSQTILASGGTPGYTFALFSGTLPTGTLIDGLGNITGTPTVAGPFNFTIQVTDAASATATKNFDVTIINAPCSPPSHTIAQIQGTGNTSPFVGNIETTSGIVTGRRSNGFFMQTPDASIDADPLTSEGIFVFTGAAPPAAAAIGNNVCVSGTVAEFIPSTDPNSPSQTELVSPTVNLLSSGNPLPAAIILTPANTNPAGGLYQLERFEGMRVQVNSLTVVAPTQGNLTESSATSVSNGFFYGVITGVARPFREPGIGQPDPLPPGAPPTVTRWDANPELIGVGSNSLGGPALDVATGAILTNVVGPLDYRSRNYTIDIDAASPPVVSNNGLTFTAVPVQTTDELTVASFNVERFYDDINDPNGDAVLTATAYANRLNKVSLAIRNVLNTPDIIGMVEVEKLTVLQAIAAKVNADAIAASQPNPNYAAYLIEGNDVGGIDVGFLVKPSRVTVTTVTQYGAATTYINPNNGLPELLNDRPPLVLEATFTKPGCTTANPITVIVNHLRSLNGVDDPIDGNRVRTKRAAQAEFLANLIQGFQTSNPAANIVSVGDYNAFEFSDGYVDMIGTIKGTPTPATDVVLASPDLVNPDLTDLADAHPAAQRYSYSFAGSAQVLDHIVVNSNLVSKINRFSIGRVDADFPEVYRNDPNRPERISDHDGPVAYILFPDVTPPTITCPAPVTVSCSSAVPVADIASVTGVSDDCSGVVTVTHQGDVISAQTCANRYTITRTYRATDAASNFAECTQIITVNDNTPPSLTCPAPVTVSCASAVPVPDIALVTGVSDNCGGLVTVTHQGDVISGQTCANRYTITRTYRATDVCGNFAQCTQIITVNDVIAPVITCPSNITVNASPGLCSAVVTFTTTATDNCAGAVTIVSVPASGTAFRVGTTTVISSATDVCGNSSNCTFTVTVVDNQPPVIVCPANIIANNTPGLCSAVVNYPLPTVTDNCCLPGAVSLTQTASQTPTAGSVACNAGGFHTANSYWRAYDLSTICLSGPLTINTVQFGIELADANGTGTTQPVTVRVYTSAGPFPVSPRTLVASQTFNVPDQTLSVFNAVLTTPPTVAVNSILILELFTPDGRAPANNRFFIGSNASAQTGPSYISAADCGFPNPTNLATIGFPNMHIILNANGVTSGPNPITQIAGLPSGSIFPVGVTTNTFRATDAAGNTAQCSFTVTVVDNQAPVITCPPSVVRNTDPNVCTSTYATPNPTTSDNCGVTSVSWVMTGATTGASPLTGINYLGTQAFGLTGTTGQGITTVTYTVKDAAGNTTTCSYTVTVNDASIPVISGQPTNQFVCVGSNGAFSVTATAGAGNPLTYQWQGWNGSAWVNIAGATNATLPLNAVTFSMNTNSYRVILTGRCSVVTSGFATLYVNRLPTVVLAASRSRSCYQQNR
ncbi:MAG: HYR domain-containing protein [Chitinophagaceae bacterium]|nr:HYR domain-containing protein [Chitinophagaceae bacterium]